MTPDKTAILNALTTFAAQRPGLDFGNYGDVSAYRAEVRSITRDLHDVRTLVSYCQLRNIQPDFTAFSGRLSVRDDGSLYYCEGQYWPTEYRKACAAVCAAAIWAWWRDECAPTPARPTEYKMWTKSKGDWIRAKAKREFGLGIASRWFS